MVNTYGYSEQKIQLQKRLNRAEGQVRGIGKMIQEDKYCIDILTQISAAQAALDKIALELVRDHAKHCLAEGAISSGKLSDEKADELVGALTRLMKR